MEALCRHSSQTECSSPKGLRPEANGLPHQTVLLRPYRTTGRTLSHTDVAAPFRILLTRTVFYPEHGAQWGLNPE